MSSDLRSAFHDPFTWFASVGVSAANLFAVANVREGAIQALHVLGVFLGPVMLAAAKSWFDRWQAGGSYKDADREAALAGIDRLADLIHQRLQAPPAVPVAPVVVPPPTSPTPALRIAPETTE